MTASSKLIFTWTSKLEPVVLKGLLLAERSFDLRTSGLWAQHASTAPLCYQWYKRVLSEGRFELPPTEVDCDLNAAP